MTVTLHTVIFHAMPDDTLSVYFTIRISKMKVWIFYFIADADSRLLNKADFALYTLDLNL